MKALRFGFSTLGCPQASWEEIVGLAARNGIPGVELRMLAGELNLAAALEKTFGSPERMATEAHRAGLEILALDSSQRVLDDEGWAEVAELARWADGLGVSWIRVFDGGDGCLDRSRFVERLVAWQEIRERFRIAADIMIETHDSLTRVDDCVLIAGDLDARGLSLNLLWDVFHTWKKGARDPVAAWKTLKPWTRHIHVKDGSEDGGRLTLPGEGKVPVPGLLEFLREDGCGCAVSLEWEAHWDRTLPPLEEAFRSGRKHGWWQGGPVDPREPSLPPRNPSG